MSAGEPYTSLRYSPNRCPRHYRDGCPDDCGWGEWRGELLAGER